MNSNRSIHPIDVPWNTTAPPQPVVDALKALIKVASDHGVPFARIIEHPEHRRLRHMEQRVRELEEELASKQETLAVQSRLIERQDKLIVDYEQRLGIDEL